MALALMLGTAGVTLFAVRAAASARVARMEKEAADRQRAAAEASEQKATAEKGRADREAQQARRLLYLAEMQLAERAYGEAAMDLVRDLLERQQPGPGQEDLRGFEWYYLWRLSHLELLVLQDHRGAVKSVAFSPDGRLLAGASESGPVRIWDAATGEEVRALRGNAGDITSVAFSPDGRRLAVASGSYDRLGEVRVWDTASGQEVRVLGGGQLRGLQPRRPPPGLRLLGRVGARLGRGHRASPLRSRASTGWATAVGRDAASGADACWSLPGGYPDVVRCAARLRPGPRRPAPRRPPLLTAARAPPGR
jgi:hypothetical protein